MEIGTVKAERKLSISTISKGRVSKEGGCNGADIAMWTDRSCRESTGCD